MQWFFLAIGSALAAAATTLLAKAGLKGVDSTLATAVRTAVVLVMAWGMAFITGAVKGLHSLTRENILFLVLSGIATGVSWLLYYKALQLGDVSRVAPIDKLSIVFVLIASFLIFHEPFTLKTAVAGLLITAGVLVLAF